MKKFFTSKLAVLGWFAVLSILLTIPLVVLMLQEKQDTRQFAEEPSVIIESGLNNPIATVTPSCTTRPTCLDSVPRCLVAEPAGGWCPSTTVFPTKAVKATPTFAPKPTFQAPNSKL